MDTSDDETTGVPVGAEAQNAVVKSSTDDMNSVDRENIKPNTSQMETTAMNIHPTPLAPPLHPSWTTLKHTIQKFYVPMHTESKQKWLSSEIGLKTARVILTGQEEKEKSQTS